ncbi:MAG: tetratricopeptide repeat protein [Candidatus Competibacteraceae bacterium]|nr:tetratricopeptide repeat protein [Candidatus Competibacteraceae bacterium]
MENRYCDKGSKSCRKTRSVLRAWLLQVRLEQLNGAIESLSRAAELATEQTHYHYVYALALDKAGKQEKAIQTLQTVLDREPAHRDAAITLANIHLQRGDTDSAKKVLDAIKRQLPEDPQIKAFEQQLSDSGVRFD